MAEETSQEKTARLYREMKEAENRYWEACSENTGVYLSKYVGMYFRDAFDGTDSEDFYAILAFESGRLKARKVYCNSKWVTFSEGYIHTDPPGNQITEAEFSAAWAKVLSSELLKEP